MRKKYQVLKKIWSKIALSFRKLPAGNIYPLAEYIVKNLPANKIC